MVITVEDLQRRFAEYNAAYFNGKLRTPKLVVGRWSCGIYGSFRHDKDGGPLISIRKSKSLGWTDDKLRRVLVHEMIHQLMEGWGPVMRIDSAAHLLVWQCIRIWMNLRWGLHIHTWGEKDRRDSRKKRKPLTKDGKKSC